MPTIREFMTPSPLTIGSDQPLSVAHRLMREHGIRHLPVLEDGKLVGLVSQRDLYFIETLRDVDPDKVTVAEAMTTETYVVTPRTHLETVAREMAQQRIGSAVVVDEQGKVVGVFTTTDALRALTSSGGGRARSPRKA